MASIFICGDIYNNVKKNGKICSGEIKQVVSSSDFAVCNFEAPVKGYGEKAHKPGPKLSQEGQTVSELRKSGFDLFLLANNHIMDFGRKGLSGMIDLANKNKLNILGAGLSKKEAYKPHIQIIDGIKIGFINACEAHYGVIDYFYREQEAGYAWLNDDLIDKNIIKLKEECDYVIVLSHAGLEYYPIPQKIWRKRYKHFCDLGADVVVGSHPHVPQGVERYNGSIVFYSLGNFFFSDRISTKKENKSFSVSLELSSDGRIEYQPIFHYRQNGLVKLSASDKINLKALNSRLNDGYEREHDEMCMATYNKLKRHLTIQAKPPIPINGDLKSGLRLFVSRMLGRANNDYPEQYQLHLLRNETYYFAFQHALQLKALDEEKNYEKGS